MWARVVEFMLGCWLAVSPFVFAHPRQNTLWWTVDWLAASAVVVCSCLSFWQPTRYAHMATLGIACGLILFGRFSQASVPPALENQIVTGLLLLMFALVPNEASLPPEGQRSGVA